MGERLSEGERTKDGPELDPAVLGARYRRVASQLADAERIAGIGVWEWDTTTGEMVWSDETFRQFGYKPDEIEPTLERWLGAIHPDDRERCQRIVDESFATGQPYEFEHRVVHTDGSVVHLHCRGDFATDDGGAAIRVVGASQDVTQRVAQQEALERLGRQREAILESAGEGICGIDAAGSITFANPAAARMLGRSIGELGGTQLSEAILDSDGIAIPFSLADGRPAVIRDDGASIRRGDGSLLPIELICTPLHENGDGAGGVVCFRDATERRRFEDQLAYLSDHDALTALYNRRRFEQELAQQISYGLRYEAALSVLLIDIDGFKDLNETLGHRAGDDLIRSVAELVRTRLRTGDLIARIGGDEFAILLPASDQRSAETVANDLRETIAVHRHAVGGEAVRVTASVGVATTGRDASTSEHLLANADIALYDAKDGGRNRIAVYSPERRGRERAADRFEWAERIRRALAEDRFELYAQPIADVRGKVSQYELLLRMRDEEGALIMPSAFMPTAERHGLVGAIDHWVVERAINLTAESQRRGRPVRVEINLSGLSVSDRATPDLIAALITAAQIDPSLLVFEITETAAIDSLSQARECAQRLRGLGCQFALDDFGAGFSSFVHLRRLPIDYVKIDGEFIRGLADNPSDRLFVQAIVTIVRGLGKQTIAEFVEDAAAAERVKELGVDFLQGFYVGEPRSTEDGLPPDK